MLSKVETNTEKQESVLPIKVTETFPLKPLC